MTAGIEVWDAAGNKTLSITDRIGVILGVVTTNSVNGSVSDANLAKGTPFAFAVPIEADVSQYSSYPIPTASGTTVSWTYYPSRSTPTTYKNSYIFYGVY